MAIFDLEKFTKTIILFSLREVTEPTKKKKKKKKKKGRKGRRKVCKKGHFSTLSKV